MPDAMKRKNWWNSVPLYHKAFIFLLVLILILVSTVTLVLASHKLYHAPKTEEFCNTSGCVHAASMTLKLMDPSANPCEDFYQFACGGWMKDVRLGNGKPSETTAALFAPRVEFDIKELLEKNISAKDPQILALPKLFYKVCLDTVSLEQKGLWEMKEILRDIGGGWPVVEGPNWNENNFDWIRAMHKMFERGFDATSIFTVKVDVDFENSSMKIIQIDEPSFGINLEILQRSYYDPHLQAYFGYMIEIAKLFGADPQTVELELLQSLKLESQLANLSRSQVDRKANITHLNNLMTIKELSQKFPFVPWLDYIRHFVKKTPIEEEEKIILLCPEYFSKLEGILQGSPKRVLANYVMWSVVALTVPFLPEKIRVQEYRLLEKIVGVQAVPQRWNECTQKTVLFLPNLVGSLYVRHYFHKDSKTQTQEITKYARKSMMENLKTLGWMDEETRKKALRKADAMNEFIAYPDELLDEKILNETYGEIKMVPGSFLTSVLNIQKIINARKFETIRIPINQTDWKTHGHVTKINAFYNPQDNGIVVTAAILQGVFFNKDRPRYMNYGGIGWIIGHEITHGFDTTGSQFDERGNLKNWWEHQTYEQFSNKTDCIIKQYDNYVVPDLNIKEDGRRSKDENIADNGGIKLAYMAYKSWVSDNKPELKLPGLKYTPDQLFWVAAAQNFCEKHTAEAARLQVILEPHALGRFRIIGSLSNSEDFSKAFSCPSGSPMNPKKKCSLW